MIGASLRIAQRSCNEWLESTVRGTVERRLRRRLAAALKETSMTYDPALIARLFDAYGSGEWHRLEQNVAGRNSYGVHRRFLAAHAREGMHALDIGSGPGRYAIDLAQLGTEVTVADLSAVQLGLARTHLSESGLGPKVRDYLQLDVTDLRCFDDESFDLVVCYGAVLSYTRERYSQGLAELYRVTRLGGIVLLSVMSLFGVFRMLASLDAAGAFGEIASQPDLREVFTGADVVYTPMDSRYHHAPMALFSSRGLRTAISAAGLEVLTMASANPILSKGARAPQIEGDSGAAERLRDLELFACEYPGLLDAGVHLIAVARRPDQGS